LNLKVLQISGKPELARVYVASLRNDPASMVEFVDACDPDLGGRNKKWVIVVSSQLGCPVNCLMCDAGGSFQGNLSATEMLAQVKRVIEDNFIDPMDCTKFKIQFARMGEPALNPQVITAIRKISELYPNAIPCLATIGPAGASRWFSELLIVRDLFADFQMQFSINTTDQPLREAIMPYPKLSFEDLSEYGRRFYRPGQRKVVLNFAQQPQWPLDAEVLAKSFAPEYFIVKLTPVNPTYTGEQNGLEAGRRREQVLEAMEHKAQDLESRGYLVIRSVGNLEENEIGSNCGQMVRKYKADIPEYEKAPA
jgi:23S rRNA (adenine2503-C2)-methyltransferase